MYSEIKKRFSEKSKESQIDQPNFGQALRQLRTEISGKPGTPKPKPIAIREISKATGIKEETIHSIENGSTQNPSFEKLTLIANFFDLTLMQLMERAIVHSAGNCHKITAHETLTINFAYEHGFSIVSFTPPGISKRDFFAGRLDIMAGKKLENWRYTGNSKMFIQVWDGIIHFHYHHKEHLNDKDASSDIKIVELLSNESLYFDGSIPHTFENVTNETARLLLLTYPPLF